MSFATADASRFANLCILALCTKTTESRLRLAGADTSKKSDLPPGHGKDSPYMALIRLAQKQHLRNREARSEIATVAVTVALDLLEQAGSFARRQDLQDALSAYNSRVTAPTRKTVEPAPAIVASSRNRANGYVPETDDEDPDPTPSAPAAVGKFFHSEVANHFDDQAEVAAALANPSMQGIAA